MLARSLLVAGFAVFAVVVLLGPGVASLETPVFSVQSALESTIQKLTGEAPANLVDRATQPGAAAIGVGANWAIGFESASATIAGPLDVVASDRARDLADDGMARDVSDLASEIAALHVAAGEEMTPEARADLEARVAELPRDFADATASLVARVRVSDALSRAATAGLTDAERVGLDARAAEMTRVLDDGHSSDAARREASEAFAALASRVDADLLNAAGLVVARALDDYVAVAGDLARDIGDTRVQGAAGDVIFTDGFFITIGGPGTTYYSGFNVIVVDLGGNDVYEDTAGGVSPWAPFRASVVVDLAGDDVYHGSFGGAYYYRDYVQGAAYLGVGALVDVQGNDRYSSQITLKSSGADAQFGLSRSQGFGMLGVGLHVDGAGDDLYNSQIALFATEGNAKFEVNMVQGVGHFGVGVLTNALGADAYNSFTNMQASRAQNDAYATWTARTCQGAALTPGVGVLIEGASANVKGASLSGADDAYNSFNTITSIGGTGAGGFGGDAGEFSSVCQGATAGFAMFIPPLEGVGVSALPEDTPPLLAVGILVDVLGDDVYNSDNIIRAYGYNFGGQSPNCRSCHVGATVSVSVNQGASGALDVVGEPPREGEGDTGTSKAHAASIGQVGVLVDAHGNDAFNSRNDLAAYGYVFAPWPDTTDAFSAVDVITSQGATTRALLPNSVTPGQVSTRAAVDPCNTPTRPPKAATDTIGDMRSGEVPRTPCMLGVFINSHGADAYNSWNVLEASGADTNYGRVTVTNSQGSGIGGIGAFLDGLIGDVGEVTIRPRCDSTRLCDAIDAASPALPRLGSSADAYNSFNDAGEKSSVTITRSIGFSSSGVGLFVDATAGTGLSTLVSISDAPALAISFPQFAGNADTYNSWNACTAFDSDMNYASTMNGGIAAFVEIFGDDTYDLNPQCASTYTSRGFGVAGGLPEIGLFVDLFGNDDYPVVASAPTGVLNGAPAPHNDDVFLSVFGPLGLGVDFSPV